MNNKIMLSVILSLTLLVSACMTQQDMEINKAAALMSNCEKIEALITEHRNSFEKLRVSKKTTGKMDIWQTRYHLVGDSCQIWNWGPGNFDYVCSVISPEQSIARERYEKAKSITRQCLDNSWKLAESSRKIGTGSKAVFAQSGNNTVVATHVVETRGLFNSEWATYYFVGDRSDQL